ncbi:MAG TPA: hypothetical protein VNG12_12590, partial [Acidimicrobiales bacterium]|nr:hypothetical protein [Acidimicrobiales bacterium]
MTWPSGAGATWNSTWQWWQTQANASATAVSLRIPTTATNGTVYNLQLLTCDPASGLCSNAPGGSGNSQFTLTVTTNWAVSSYSQDFTSSAVATVPTGYPGAALDVAFNSGDTAYNTFEVGDGIGDSGLSGKTMSVIHDRFDGQYTPF